MTYGDVLNESRHAGSEALVLMPNSAGISLSMIELQRNQSKKRHFHRGSEDGTTRREIHPHTALFSDIDNSSQRK